MTKQLFKKELRLSASPLSYLFILFGVLTMAPGYPILLAAFFVTFGIFHSFQSARENSDILYTALLPIAKKQVVKAKFLFCGFIEGCSFLLITILCLIRMTVLKDATAYRNNALMNANFVFLGFVLVAFGLFNFIFVRGFFKTAYKFAAPFVKYIVAVFVLTGFAETLHHIPALKAVNAFGFDNLFVQIFALVLGLLIFLSLTLIAFKSSVCRFEKIDL